MTKTVRFSLMLALCAWFVQCSTDDTREVAVQKIQFTVTSTLDDGTIDDAFVRDVPEGASVRISLTTPGGKAVWTDQQLTLRATENGGYATEPIRLARGSYVVSAFTIVDKNADELYVAADVEGMLIDAASFDKVAVGPENENVAAVLMQVNRCHGGHGRKPSLKEFVLNGRSYELYYNTWGAVDSIVATDAPLRYVYRAVYTNGRLDSVGTYDGGQYVSVNKDFQYNNKGKITGFNYYFRYPGAPWDLAFPSAVTYDYRGRVSAIDGTTLQYNWNNNVTQYNNGIDVFTYTYDWGRNPFNTVDNLFVIMVEERFMWEHVFSCNNVVTKNDGGSVTNFTNVYDYRGRLVSNGKFDFYY